MNSKILIHLDLRASVEAVGIFPIREADNFPVLELPTKRCGNMSLFWR
jgi:hypothetical protein